MSCTLTSEEHRTTACDRLLVRLRKDSYKWALIFGRNTGPPEGKLEFFSSYSSLKQEHRTATCVRLFVRLRKDSYEGTLIFGRNTGTPEGKLEFSSSYSSEAGTQDHTLC